jgi:2,3-bisphosphoglycerate-independent phosphoglycerate mutase
MPRKKQSKSVQKSLDQPVAPMVFMILDGFGLGDPKDPGNAVTPDTAPNIFRYMKDYASTRLMAHGIDVGLFPEQAGNSEAGHLNIGAGRVVIQDLAQISHAIADGTFFKNEAFHQGLFHAQKYGTNVHIMGLLTDGQSAHAYPDHLYALLKYFRKHKQKNIYLHLFTDGRDAPPHGAVGYLRDLRARMQNGEKIATVMGRFYPMDRNKVWERTAAAYHAMVCGIGLEAASAEEAIAAGYNRGETDEYIKPTVIVEGGKPVATINNNDVVYFFNARSDRARQITKAFVQKHFQKESPGSFKRRKAPKNIRFVAMSDFGPDLPGIFTAFPSPDNENGLAKAIDDARRQLYISETEKYAHVTYFINGGYAEAINGEDREVVSSGTYYSYADHPAMHCREVSKRILSYLAHDQYNFITVNFPNADMLGHTGNLAATKKGIRVMDVEVRRIVEAVLKKNGQVMITADHGNAEKMINHKTGEMMTEHTTNPVPCILINHKKGIKMKKGRLADVAPTILKMLDIQKPKEMTGESLF